MRSCWFLFDRCVAGPSDWSNAKSKAAGFSTISLAMIPELIATTGAPRIAAVEHPFGLTVGLPHDTGGQLAVLRATLQALGAISEPGGVVDLPFEWTDDAALNILPPQPPPIVSYLRRHPWAIPRFFNRTPPAPAETETQ